MQWTLYPLRHRIFPYEKYQAENGSVPKMYPFREKTMIKIDKNDLLSRLDLLAVYEAETGHTLKAGENLIHSPLRDDRSPSFCINTVSGLWKDFGTGQGGDVIGFIQLRHGLDFPGALEYLSRYVNGSPATIPKNRRKVEPAKTRAVRQGVRGDYLYRELCYSYKIGEEIKWKRGISFPEGNPPDYFNEKVIDRYHSFYLHSKDIVSYFEKNKRLAGYQGACWADRLYIDIDFKGNTLLKNIGQAQQETIRVIQRLKNNGVASYKIKFSGSKGFHTEFYHPALDMLSGYVETPEHIQKFASKLFSGINCDPMIYDKGVLQVVRSTNSINSKSGLYAIPLSEAEIFTLSPGEIIDLAKKPRPMPKEFTPVRFHSHLLDENGTIHADNVIFDNGATFAISEIDLLKKEKNKENIKALFLIKKHFSGEIKKDGGNGKT